MRLGVKKFVDRRLDITKSHTLDIMGRKRLDAIKSFGRIKGVSTRLARHPLEGQTRLAGSPISLIQEDKSLMGVVAGKKLSGKQGSGGEDTMTEYEKQVERVKEAFRRSRK